MSNGGHGGFTLIEALIALGLLVAVFGATFQILAPSQGIFRAQPEVAAVHQRLRVAADALAADLRGAGSGPRAGDMAGALVSVVPPVAPAAARDDSVVREDAISVLAAPPTGAVAAVAAALPPGSVVVPLGAAPCQPVSGTACGFRAGMRVLLAGAGAPEIREVEQVTPPDVLRLDRGLAFGHAPGTAVLEVVERAYRLDVEDGESTLVRLEDGGPALPVVDHVVGLRFDYFDAAGPVSHSALADGPWVQGPSPWRHDLDLWRVQRVRVTVRVEAASAFRGPAGPWFTRGGTAAGAARVPDREVAFDVTLRNAGPPP